MDRVETMRGRYLALLRGVNNIGSEKRIAMVELRAAFERLGLRDVRTLGNSGNVAFSAAGQRRSEIVARIARALDTRLILLSGREVVGVVRDNPFVKLAKRPSDLLVMVPRTRSELKRLEPLLARRWAPERLALGSRVAYLWCARGVPRSPIWAAVDRELEHTGTVRNIGTFTKAAAWIEG